MKDFILNGLNNNAKNQWFFHYMGNNQYKDQSIRFGLGEYLYSHLNDNAIFSNTSEFIQNVEETYKIEKIKIEAYLDLCRFHNNDWQPIFDNQDEYDEHSDIFEAIANYEDTYVRSESDLRIKKMQWLMRYVASYKHCLLFAKQVIKYKPKIIKAITLDYFSGGYKENAFEIIEFTKAVKDIYPLNESQHNIISGYFSRTEDTGFWKSVEDIIPEDWKP